MISANDLQIVSAYKYIGSERKRIHKKDGASLIIYRV